MTPLELATLFHETYERLAPKFGYTTRPETRKFDETTPNGRLMVAVCGEILQTSHPQIAFVDGDDWEGLYLNGKLVKEGHNIRTDDLLCYLGFDAEYLYADDEWLAEQGRLPENLEDVKRG
jgi:hypothetical protein